MNVLQQADVISTTLATIKVVFDAFLFCLGLGCYDNTSFNLEGTRKQRTDHAQHGLTSCEI